MYFLCLFDYSLLTLFNYNNFKPSISFQFISSSLLLRGSCLVDHILLWVPEVWSDIDHLELLREERILVHVWRQQGPSESASNKHFNISFHEIFVLALHHLLEEALVLAWYEGCRRSEDLDPIVDDAGHSVKSHQISVQGGLFEFQAVLEDVEQD